jgi:hypothetical protein
MFDIKYWDLQFDSISKHQVNHVQPGDEVLLLVGSACVHPVGFSLP